MGINAYDYDILNNYGETDYQIDLFEEIREGYEGRSSIFDDIKQDDVIMAFFPCTRFECQCSINFRGEANQMKKWSDKRKLEYDLYLHEELARNYTSITELALIAIDRGLKIIIENPATKPHYLTSYWPIKPKIIDKDRRKNGDRQKKPTQYWFIGCEPKNNLVFESLNYVSPRTHEKTSSQEKRSEIHPQYANRFIRQYLIDEMEE